MLADTILGAMLIATGFLLCLMAAFCLVIAGIVVRLTCAGDDDDEDWR